MSCELSARQKIHMKYQTLLYLKKKKKMKLLSAINAYGALRV